ncbi:MAG: MipA/OmpV family protein [Gammaproteobacteria bacterium]|nr:MipA/OmpV family protein [Gammaproteobacteria bacterium]
MYNYRRWQLLSCIALFGSLMSAPSLAEKTELEWDLGIGLTGLHLPVYPGASKTKNYLFPFPYFYLKTEYLEVDEGVRGFVYQSEKLRLNLSADFGVPVDNEDNGLRAGMPELNLVLQLGPMLEVILSGGRHQPYESRIELPLRAAIATDIDHTDNIGWLFEPRYAYEKMRPRKNGWAYQVSAGLRYASKEYHGYYYNVNTAFATVTRPAYSADKGYSGAFVDVIGSWRQDNTIYGVFARYQNLSGTAYEDSPLMEQDSYFSVGAGIIWRFAGN